MKLYTYDPAPNPRRLQLFLDYKGIEVDTVQIDMMKQQQFAETFRKINPMCTVPALVLDDGTVLTEVIGACVYLDEIFPERPLMGTTPLEKALVISWTHSLFNSLYHAFAEPQWQPGLCRPRPARTDGSRPDSATGGPRQAAHGTRLADGGPGAGAAALPGRRTLYLRRYRPAGLRRLRRLDQGAGPGGMQAHPGLATAGAGGAGAIAA